MAIPELETVRSKYPQYKDMGDVELATALANKYPAYSDLLDKVQKESPKSTKSLPEKIGQNFIDAAKYTYTDGVSPVLSGLNNFAFGIPKAAIGAVGGQEAINAVFPEQTSMQGKALRLASEARGFVGGLAGKAGGAIASKLIPLSAKDTVASNMVRSAIAGGVAGTTQLTPGTDIQKQINQGAVAAAGGAALSGVGDALENLPKTLNWASKKTMEEYLRPKQKYLLYGKKPEMVPIDENITAMSADDLLSKMKSAQKNVGSQIGNVINTSTKTADYTDAVKPIDDTIARLTKDNPKTMAGVIEKLKSVKSDLLHEVVNQNGVSSFDDLTNLTPKQAFELKDRATKMTIKNPFSQDPKADEVFNETLRKVYRNVAKKLQSTEPALKDLDRRYSNLKSAIPSLEDRIVVADRNRFIGMGDAISAGIGGMAGMAAGTAEAGAAGLAGIGINKLSQTAFAKTNLSRFFNNQVSKSEKINDLIQTARKSVYR